MRERALALAFWLGGELAAAGFQTPSAELARQHLESGVQFYNQRRFQQALNDFNIIVTSMADTEYADDALLKIGEYYLDIEENFAKARENFEAVLQRYPTGDAAPGAYHYLGLLLLRSSRGSASVDDALANFQRVIRLYPRSSWVAAAQFASGGAMERAARWEQAVDAYTRVIAEHPVSSWAAGAQLAIGLCAARLGDPLQAMIELQQVRNRFPESGEAERALDRLTLLYRLYGLPKLGKPVSFRLDPSFRLTLPDKLKQVETIRVSERGIHVLDRGRKQLLSFDRGGKLVGTAAAAEARGLSVDPRGTLLVANQKAVLVGGSPVGFAVPAEKGPKPLEKITAAARDRLKDTFVFDDDQKRVLRFDPDGKLRGPFPDPSQREILRLELDGAGNLLLLDKKDRSVAIYGPEGRLVGSIGRRGQGYELKKPADLALDPAGFLYLLDQELGQVAVFDPSYRLVVLLGSAHLGGGALKKPLSLDVDESGDLYVYDDELKAVLHLR